jgi:hypothetical protein
MNFNKTLNCFPERRLYNLKIERVFTNSTSTTCQICKNEETKRILNEIDLATFTEFYQSKNFRVYTCELCNALFHFKYSKK